MNILRRRRRGLTLIELLVVLFILSALAGVAVAVLPNFQKRTHGSTSAVSIRSVETAIVANQSTRGAIGNGFDALNDGTVVPDYVGNGTTFTTGTLTVDQVGALNDIGISEVFPAAFASFALLEADPAAENATFDGHNYTAAVTFDDTTPMTLLTGAAITAVTDTFNLAGGTTPVQVVALGLGAKCTLVGAGQPFREAPVHTPGEGSAVTNYSRYCVLIGINADDEAFYIGTTCIDDGENLNGIAGNLGEYFESNE